MRKIILFLLLITSFISNAQNAQDIIDGLKKELQTKPDEKRETEIFSDLIWQYRGINTDSAIVYGEKALGKKIIFKDSTLLGQTYSNIGAVYLSISKIDIAKKNYLKAYEIRKIQKDKAAMARISANLGGIYNFEHNNVKALKHFLESVAFFESINNQELVATTYSNMSNIFIEQKDYNKALLYAKKAIDIFEKGVKSQNLCYSYGALGNCYLAKNDTLNAKIAYEKGIKAAKEIGNKAAVSKIYVSLSSLSLNDKKNIKVDSIMNLADEYGKNIKLQTKNSYYILTKGENLLNNKEYLKAKAEFLIAKKNYSKDKDNKALLETYRFLLITNNKLSLKDSVDFYINEYALLQDKVINNKTAKINSELETKYQTAKKEQEISKKNNQIIIASIVALSFLLLGFLLYKNQKTKNQQQKQESELKEALLKIEAENQLQEQRMGISKELHDNIGSQLTFVISSIDTLKQNYPSTNEKIDSQLENINAFTKNTITELRDTVWIMNTKDIDANALKERLLENIERAKMSNPNINFKVNISDFSIDNSQIALNLYRTIQEAVNNALKYAKASEIEVSIHEKENKILALVVDNGLGFDLETAKKGNGLKNMKKRVQVCKGNFEITSQENFGTTINIEIPKYT